MAASINSPSDAEKKSKVAPNISADDEQALLLHHFNKLREQSAKVDEARAALDAERTVMTDLFHTAKVDGFSRKELQMLLSDTKALRRDLVAEEERRAKLRAWLGLPAGAQADLFAAMPIEAKDEADAEAQGYLQGIRGEEPVLPDGMAPRFHTNLMTGWHNGQAQLAKGLSRAAELAEPVKTPEPPAPEVDPTDEEELKKAARKLKREGFLNRGTPAPDGEGQDAA